MSSVSLVSLSERLLSQNAAQGQDIQASQKLPVAQDDRQAAKVTEDQFTSSGHSNHGETTAQAAGLFTVQQPPLFAPAANSALQQAASSTPSSKKVLEATQPAASASPQNAISTAAAPEQTSPPTTDSTYTQQQLQPLNEALLSLGLSQQDIQKLDQIAAISNDFSPAAFTALAYQMEELAPPRQRQMQLWRQARQVNPLPSQFRTPKHWWQAANHNASKFVLAVAPSPALTLAF